MIASLRGTLIYTDTATAVVECGGVGMKCAVSLNTLRQLPPVGKECFLLTHMSVREDAIDLFGFADDAELELFRLITAVSGVGPKLALSILSAFEPARLSLFIAGGDAKSLTAASGVGAKLAQRLVLELKDKIGGVSLAAGGDTVAAVAAVTESSSATEAVQALVSLGYSQSEASLAVGKLDASLPVETLIKEGLKALARF